MKTKLLSVDYLGFTAMDRRFSSAMLPWVLLEIRRRGTKEKLCLGLENGSVQAYDVNFELQFVHKLQNIMRFTQVASNPTEFLYLVRDAKESLLYCYLFQAATVDEVTELFGHMKELAPHGGSLQSLRSQNGGSESSLPTSGSKGRPQSGLAMQRSTSVSTNKGFQLARCDSTSGESINRLGMPASKSYTTGLNRSSSTVNSDSSSNAMARSTSNAANLTSLCVDISPSNSHFFEVLYVGKIKVSHKKVPESLIDDALGKFKDYETDKAKAVQMRRNSLLSSQADSFSSDRDSVERAAPSSQKKVEFAPPPPPYRRGMNIDLIKNAYVDPKECLQSPSLTPLDASKHFFSEEDLKSDEKDVDKEFDQFSAVRVTSPTKPLILCKKSFPVALEPNVLILNANNGDNSGLATLTEDDSEGSPSHGGSRKVSKEESTSDTDSLILMDQENKFDTRKLQKIDKISTNVDKIDYSEKKDEDLLNELKFKNGAETAYQRDRSASIGTLNLNKTPIAQLIGDQNRTMLFQVARSDLRLISPDRKQILLHKQLKDVASCVQGVSNKEHFGFICREADMECFVGYVFKCQSDSVACDVVGAITQAFVANAEFLKQGKETSPLSSCEHCPMVWYHKLCQDLEGLNDKRIYNIIIKRVEQLPEEEQEQIMTKYQGGAEESFDIGEQNAFLMMLLRAHCEAKQQRHVHDTAENRSEFLNQYLGGSTIFMKAKRSLSSSFDHLLKRKPSKDDFGPMFKKESSPSNNLLTPTRDSNLDLPLDNGDGSTKNIGTSRARATSLMDPSTIQNMTKENVSLNLSENKENEKSPSPQLKSPMMDIFMKLGNNPSPKNDKFSKKQIEISIDSDESSMDHSSNQGSWRQAIFNRVVQSGVLEEADDKDNSLGSNGGLTVTTQELLRRPPSFSNLNQAHAGKRTKDEIRELWKKSINQAILLIRMEKENARLRARQEVSAVKRIKLEYEDIGGCGNENSKVWDMLTTHKESRLSTKVDSQMLFQAVRHGVPRTKRGEVWYFLAEQFCLHQPPPDTRNVPNYSTPYESLLKQLTSHQHAILIDLGRTFPNHTYFSSPLGPGQLALFNLLKAYSLLDPEVGYCQGLSFVAGVLLLHLDEAEAFLMLRHLMFRRGMRRQYLPDMVALQIQLYQLSRLLKDHLPELYERFDMYDVSPTLYAAPWILTVFTSQFPLGFVTRVFDLLFLESTEVIFRVAIALLEIHKDSLMQCDSFEEIMDYLKHKMPNIDKPMLDKVIKLTFKLDFSRQLHEYQVEYQVLLEEMNAIAPKMEALERLEKQNRDLQNQNRQLLERLETSASKISAHQISQCRLENQVKSLEQTVANLARYIGTTYDKKRDVELPNDIRKLCQQVQQTDRKTLGSISQKLGQSFASKFSSTDFTATTTNGNGATSSLSEESSSDPDDKNAADKNNKNLRLLKTGVSSPNLFAKKEKPPTEVKRPDSIVVDQQQNLDKKRQFLAIQKSYSCNAGLVANQKSIDQYNNKDNANSLVKFPTNARGVPLRVLDETNEYEDTGKMEKRIVNTVKTNILTSPVEPRKTSKFFANSHEQIRQERLQAKQLKRDFDDNLRKLDARLNPFPNEDGIKNAKSPTSPPSLGGIKLQLNANNNNGDSGLGTPISPPSDVASQEKLITNKSEAADVNHPLIGCDLDIKFDVQPTKLKSLRQTSRN